MGIRRVVVFGGLMLVLSVEDVRGLGEVVG